MSIKIVCVCKTGGVYDKTYIDALKNGIKRWINDVDFEFVCFSDLEETFEGKIPLRDNLPGWWSKLEVFRLTGEVIYFDLDTVIVGSLQSFVENFERADSGSFFMLKAFNFFRRHASGIMAWKGDFSFIYNDFKKGLISKYQMDQKYISAVREPNGFIQDLTSGIYSYKHHCVSELPRNAKIVCFHGTPRPHQVKTKWMLENWNV